MFGKRSNKIAQIGDYSITSVLKQIKNEPLVYLGEHSTTHESVVIKKSLSNSTDASLKRFINQTKVNFEHPNIVPITDYFKFGDAVYIVSPYVESISLKEFYTKQTYYKHAAGQFYSSLMKQAIAGLDALHKREIVHLDIRPQNMLLHTQNGKIDYTNPKISLIDFGSAKFPDDNAEPRPYAFTYSPPEQVFGMFDLLNPTCDIYALAVSFYEIMSRTIPFYHTHPEFLLTIQLTQCLKPHKRIDLTFFEILKKSTSKHDFKLPPNRYSREVLTQFFREAQSKRYATVSEIADALKTLS